MKKLTIIICTILGLFICSCRPIGRLSILDISDPAHPVICISRDPHCIGIHQSLSRVNIEEVDSNYHTTKEMWYIININSEQKFVTRYGVLPKGWEGPKPASPLELNKVYSMNRDYFFSIYKIDGKIKSIVSRKLEKVYKTISSPG